MAEGVLIHIAESLLKHLGSRALEETALAWGFKARLERLEKTINTIKDVLMDAEERQLHSHAIRGWLQSLKAVVYDADDLFDEFSTMASQKQANAIHGSKLMKEVNIFFSCSNQIKVAFSISHKIKTIREKLDEIDQDGKQFAFVIRPYEEPRVVHSISQGRETYSFVDVEEVVGRQDDKKAILDILGQYQQQRVCVVPIVGIGGLGKTTLAQLVYNELKKGFDLSLWVCVSDDFDVKEIVRNILKSATNTEPQNLELDQLQKQLQSQINGKKYLLVLDDVWNDDVEKWHKLRALLKVGIEGSKILVTTRLMEVANIMGTIPDPYVLKGLSEDESLILFTRMAFAPGQEEKNPELSSIGKKIVKKCANVPLALRTLGSLLRGKNQRTWLSLKDRSLAEIPENGNHIMDILKVSYHHLNSPLKNCFAYCALFRKDCELQKRTLINLWMAQGFVIPAHRSQSLEDASEEYFLTLLQRGFFHNITRDDLGNIESCKMHDLLHDLALEVAGIECKVAKLGEMDFDERAHHLSFGYRLNSLWKIPSSVQNMKLLRTFLLLEQMKDGSIFSKSMCHKLLSSCRFLRVLDLHNFGVKTLPNSIGRLIHLRYLNLSRTSIKALPDSVTELQNLQTLDLNACFWLERLPAGIGKLTNLSTLDVGECHTLTQMPSGLGALTSLHNLPYLLVNDRISRASRSNTPAAQLGDLKNLIHLRGSLQIIIRGLLNDPAYESKEAKLSSKDGLMELHIEGDKKRNAEVSGIKHDEAVLEGLKPHSNLKKLKITWYRGEMLPSWAVMDNLCINLPNLVEIQLISCGRCQQVPSFSQLPFLKCLCLISLRSVEYMESGMCELAQPQEHKSFFSSLQELTLMDMDNLQGWWKEIGKVGNDLEVLPVGLAKFQQLSGTSFSKLSKLHLERCPNLKSMPHCPKVEDLALVDVNENLMVLRLAANFAVSGATTTTTSKSSGSSSKLKTLCVGNIGDLISLPKEYLSHLTSLDIRDPKLLNTCSLEEVFRRSSNSVRSLTFLNCHSLTSISGGLEHLTLLEKLVIWNCEELDLSHIEDDMPWKALKNLRSLQFHVVPKLVTLPFGLQHLTNLRSLDIRYNNRFEALPEWISCFLSLEQMELYGCPKLTSLPEEFRELTGLNQLTILECHGLTKRCRGPAGEDWPKIQHIPFVSVHASVWDS